MHAFMRADDGSVWEGCPRAQLLRVLDAYATEGLSALSGGWIISGNAAVPVRDGNVRCKSIVMQFSFRPIEPGLSP